MLSENANVFVRIAFIASLACTGIWFSQSGLRGFPLKQGVLYPIAEPAANDRTECLLLQTEDAHLRTPSKPCPSSYFSMFFPHLAP
jgi:hypothetical protein